MVTNGSVRHGEIKCSGYEPNHNCRNQAITLKLVALRKSLRLVIRDVSERSAVPFPNSFDPPVIKLRRFGGLFVRFMFRLNREPIPNRLAASRALVAVRKSQHPSPGSYRGVYTV